MTHALSTTRLTSWVGVCALGLVMWIAVSAGALAQSPPSAEARLKELSITLPSVPPPVANYVDAVRVGNLLFLAGNTAAAAFANARRNWLRSLRTSSWPLLRLPLDRCWN
jgi:hypothetical protein